MFFYRYFLNISFNFLEELFLNSSISNPKYLSKGKIVSYGLVDVKLLLFAYILSRIYPNFSLVNNSGKHFALAYPSGLKSI